MKNKLRASRLIKLISSILGGVFIPYIVGYITPKYVAVMQPTAIIEYWISGLYIMMLTFVFLLLVLFICMLLAAFANNLYSGLKAITNWLTEPK